MWNYGRIDFEKRKKYFQVLKDNFKDEVVNSFIDYNRIQKYCKYGGLWAIRNDMKFVLDLMLWFRSIVKG